MPKDCISARPTVRYRVHWVILRRPSSPSFCSFSSVGTTTVNSCRMIDAVMYGMMPSAKIVSRRNVPPREQIDEAEKRAGVLPDELFELEGIDTGRRNMRAQPVDRQQPKREQNPVPEIRNAEDIGEASKNLFIELLPVPGYRSGDLAGSTTRQPCPRPLRSFLSPRRRKHGP